MASTVNLKVYSGDTYFMSVTWNDSTGTPIDNSGYTALMEFRKKATSADPALVTLTDGAGITLNGVDGTIDIEIADTETPLITNNSVYDLQMTETATGVVTTLIAGTAALTMDVSRA